MYGPTEAWGRQWIIIYPGDGASACGPKGIYWAGGHQKAEHSVSPLNQFYCNRLQEHLVPPRGRWGRGKRLSKTQEHTVYKGKKDTQWKKTYKADNKSYSKEMLQL